MTRKRGTIIGGTAALVVAGAIGVMQLMTVSDTGQLSFTASLDHARVTDYTVRLRRVGSLEVVDTKTLGVPTPDSHGVIVVDLVSFFASQDAGIYTLSILATDAGGSTDSTPSAPFRLPLL